MIWQATQRFIFDLQFYLYLCKKIDNKVLIWWSGRYFTLKNLIRPVAPLKQLLEVRFFLVGDNTLIFHLDLGNKKTRTPSLRQLVPPSFMFGVIITDTICYIYYTSVHSDINLVYHVYICSLQYGKSNDKLPLRCISWI